MDITITIPDDKVNRAVTAIVNIYPKGDSELTDNQWAKECLVNFIKRTVLRYEEKVAKDAVNVDVGDIAS